MQHVSRREINDVRGEEKEERKRSQLVAKQIGCSIKTGEEDGLGF